LLLPSGERVVVQEQQIALQVAVVVAAVARTYIAVVVIGMVMIIMIPCKRTSSLLHLNL